MDKKIVMTQYYLKSAEKLNGQNRKQAMNTIEQMMTDLSIPSLKVHSIDKMKCDEDFRSARVSGDLRLIFHLKGDFCTLLYIDHHDAAYDWCKGKWMETTDFGASYLFDVVQEKQKLEEFDEKKNECMNQPGILQINGITVKELKKLGIPEIHSNNLLNIYDDEQFLQYIEMFPEELQEALLDLYDNKKEFGIVYNELIDHDKCVEKPKNLDFAQSLLQKDSGRRFYVTQSMEELEYLVANESFEKWTTFLHPSQERLVKMNTNGPLLVEGGPGTGKTVLGMHRAVYLSEKVHKAEDGKRILFCTFSKKLAKYILHNLTKLYQQKGVQMNVDVLGVDQFISKQLGEARPNVNVAEFDRIFNDVYRREKRPFSIEFYKYEYVQVLERYGVLRREEYLNVNRKGMGIPLNQRQRNEVWDFFAELYKAQNRSNVATFVNCVEKLELMIDKKKIEPMYDAIIIDEAQDLQPVKLRVLNKCVKSPENGVLLLSDFNQRVYNLVSWKSDTDIDIVGRTHYLEINYRTTKEICDYATDSFFKGSKREGYMKSYKSIVKGVEPTVQKFDTIEKQWNSIIVTICALKTRNIPLNEICVVFPHYEELNLFIKKLKEYGIEYVILKDDVIPEEHEECLCLGNAKAIKGLEFSVVMMTSVEQMGKNEKHHIFDGKDDIAKRNFEKQVDCEKYVAMTRARDELVVTYIEK